MELFPEIFTKNVIDVLESQVLKYPHHYVMPPLGEDITLRPFQGEVLVEINNLFRVKPIVSGEIYCAGGKTIISGFAGIPYLKNDRVNIFLSPKRDAFPHFEADLRRVMQTHGLDPDLVYAAYSADQPTFPPDKRWCIVNHYDIVKPNAGELERKVITRTMERAGLIAVDESHKVPGDAADVTKIIGQVEGLIKTIAIPNGAHVLTMTGTHWRSCDGKFPFGIERPDIVRTCQQLIMAGVLPVLYGFEVPIKVDAQSGDIEKSGDDLILFTNARRKMTQYLGDVADVIMETIRIEHEFAKSVGARRPGGHAIFVSRRPHAREITDILNERLGREAFVPYVSDEIAPCERSEILEKLRDGTLLGYATCMMGVESLNVPRLKYAHNVARSTSGNKIMQSLGRIMRLPDTDDCKKVKDKAIVIDYQVMKKQIINLAMGIRDIARLGGSEIAVEGGGGQIFRSPQPGPTITSILLGKYAPWLTRECGKPAIDRELLTMAAMRAKGMEVERLDGEGRIEVTMNDNGEIIDLAEI